MKTCLNYWLLVDTSLSYAMQCSFLFRQQSSGNFIGGRVGWCELEKWQQFSLHIQHVTKFPVFFKLLLRASCCVAPFCLHPLSYLCWVWIPLKLNTNHIGKYMSGKKISTEQKFSELISLLTSTRRARKKRNQENDVGINTRKSQSHSGKTH